jgi:hypothetical protein
MSTPNQIAANQANSRLSTGPKTEEGKAKSSHNAVRTGLTGQTVLLPSDDVEAYQKHVARFEAECKPVADREKELTQKIAELPPSDHFRSFTCIASGTGL